MLKKIKIHFVDGRLIRRFYLFGYPIVQYTKENNRKCWRLCKKQEPKDNQRVFYLKVHRVHQTSFDCIQHWMDVIARMDAFIYFVCDNPKMKYGIFKKPCYFYNENFAFIKSDRRSLKKYIAKILHNVERKKMWQRIASSMLTPFVHAKKHNYSKTYNIDADDIMILSKPELIAEAFKKAEIYADKHDLDCFNFDMFVSKSFGVHWSFGVVYVRNAENVLDVLKKNVNWRENNYLIEKFKTIYIKEFNFNVDWLFTFLRDTKQLNLKTFYIENSSVVHMPDIAISRHWAFVLHWSNGVLYFPIIDKLYADKKWSKLPIFREAIKIDIGLEPENHLDFMNQFYSTTYWFENNILDFARYRGMITEKEYKKYRN